MVFLYMSVSSNIAGCLDKYAEILMEREETLAERTGTSLRYCPHLNISLNRKAS
jgi:hypothetical protein